ncbi:MAG: dephospho-CoA kinase [Planctomycetaceae bacterium]
MTAGASRDDGVPGGGVRVVGIVGPIGSGKSTVARILGELGAEVIDADRIAHEVLGEEAVRRELRRRHGDRVFAPDGAVDRRALAAAVFGPGPEHAEALGHLEGLVHPRVHERIAARLAAARAAAAVPGAPARVVVLDVPLLVRAGWVAECDRVVVLACDDGVRRARIAARHSPAQIAAREAAWNRDPPDGLPADRVRTVDTGRDVAYTRSQVEDVWRDLRGPA